MGKLALFLALGALGMAAMWLIVRLMLAVVGWIQTFAERD